MIDRKSEDEKEIARIVKLYNIDKNDAIILILLNELVSAYERFLEEIILIRKQPDSKTYNVELNITDFYNEKEKVTRKIVNVETILRESHSTIVQQFNTTLNEFRTKIESLTSTGDKEIVLQIQSQIRTFRLELSDLIKSGKPEVMIDSYLSQTEDRALKIWTSGLKKLAKHEKALILLFWLIDEGKGLDMSKKQISMEMRETEAWVESQLKAIKENAPELLGYGKQIGGLITYYVPKPFHKFHIGGKRNA